ELRRIEIRGSVPRLTRPGAATFDPALAYQRAALLLDHGSIYVAFSAPHPEETPEYHGWVFRYDPAGSTVPQRGLWCSTPDGIGPEDVPDGRGGTTRQAAGAGIWQAGGGLAADEEGNVYFNTGNGIGPVERAGSFGDSFVKLTPVGDQLLLSGWF